MKRLVVVYNPRSTRQAEIQEKVLAELRGLGGYLVGKFAVKKASLEENARSLAGFLMDGDLVLTVGGDGTASMTLNAVVQSGKAVTLAGLAYGNFNDLGKIIGVDGGVTEVVRRYEAGETREIYPLEVKIDGEHWRYVLGYVSVGMLAASTAVFEEPKVRSRLKTGKTGRCFSIWTLAKWYFRKRHTEQWLPKDSTLNGQKIARMTDYVAVNGPQIGGVMRGGDWYLKERAFGSGAVKLNRFLGLMKFMMRSMTKGMPLRETEGDRLEFAEEAEVMMQGEGEFRRVKAKRIEVVKNSKGVISLIPGNAPGRSPEPMSLK